MRIYYTLLTFYLICLSVTVQKRDVLTREWQVAFKDLSQDQQTCIILFLTHVVVAVWIFIYVYGVDTVNWSQSSSQDTECKQNHSTKENGTTNLAKMHSNTEHLKNDNEEWNGMEMQASTDCHEKVNDNREEWNTVEMQATEELATDNDDEELNDSYLSILVDCIRVMISQAANEEEARSIIHQALTEEFPKYFGNDKVIDCLLALSNNLCNGIVLESKVTDAAGVSSAFGQNEDKTSLQDEDMDDVASQEEDQEYVTAITDKELISMISDILWNSCETGESGGSYFLFEDHDASEQRPVSPMVNKEEEDQQHELQNAKESKIVYTDGDGLVEMSSSVRLLDQMHFLSGSASDGSYLESTHSQRGSLWPMRKESLDGSFSWPSLPGHSRIPASEDEFDGDTDAFSAVPRYTFSTPTCVITTSSCQSCKDAEQELQSMELTPALFLPTAARLYLSGSTPQGSFSDVLSKLTQAKRSVHKRKTAAARELWSEQEKDTSIFNASFSISSLEDMLSPESIPPSSSSPVFGSPEKSPNLLGIRLHKPAGFKDIFLSIVDQDKKTALPRNISETWTLGTREEMELILHVDTSPHQNATRTYSGRYYLVFNDILSDREEYLSNEDSQKNFGFSMLSNDENGRENRVSTSDEEYYEGFLSCEDENQEPIALKILQANDLEKRRIISLESKEKNHQKEEELPQNEKSDHDDIKANGSKGEELPQDEKFDHDQSRSTEKLREDSLRDKERIFAFACLALTSYLVHRYLK